MTSISATLSSSDRLASSGARIALILLRARAVLVLVLLLILFSALAPSFLTTANLSILTKHVAISAILAIGMTFVILSGGIDLSVGSVAGLGGMVAGYILTQGVAIGGSTYHPAVFVAILATIALCLVVGALNGWLVSRAGVAPSDTRDACPRAGAARRGRSATCPRARTACSRARTACPRSGTAGS